MLHPETFNRAELTTWMTDARPLDLLHDIPDRDGTRRQFDELAARSGNEGMCNVTILTINVATIQILGTGD